LGKVITITNQKGGVGKTTTAINLSSCLGMGKGQILLIDMDPQANATTGLGVNGPDIRKSIYEVLVEGIDISHIFLSTPIETLTLAPSHIHLVGAEIELASLQNREFRLRQALESIRDEFEFIFIDCPPSLGLLTINSLVAADSVLIPIQCEYYALEGLSLLLQTIRLVQKSLNSRLSLEGVLLTMYDSRLNLAKQIQEEVRSFFRNKVYKTVIYRNVRISEAPSHGKPIITFAAGSVGANNYRELAKEFIRNGNKEFR